MCLLRRKEMKKFSAIVLSALLLAGCSNGAQAPAETAAATPEATAEATAETAEQLMTSVN